MAVKKLIDLTIEVLIRLTLKYGSQVNNDEKIWKFVNNVWCYIILLPCETSELYYNQLSSYLHFLSHDCKIEEVGYNSFSATDVFNLLITCQIPKLSFNYRLKRQRLNPSESIPITNKPCLDKYICNNLTELDFSGADFCCNDSLLIHLLPKCQALNILCLGNIGSGDVLEAAKNCPLTKLQLEEKCPLKPKLSQQILLHYLLGYIDGPDKLNSFLDLCKTKTLFDSTIESELEEVANYKKLCLEFLESFSDKCKPTWPNLQCLIFGNCRLCREALLLCLLVLNDISEISIHRIQSDEILNTCGRIFDSLGIKFAVNLKHLNLWAGWAGFRNRTLAIAPKANDLEIIAYGYSSLNLQEMIDSNRSLHIYKLKLVGVRNFGPSIFHNSSKANHLNRIKVLELSGVILTTEELVNIVKCINNLVKFKVDYSEIQNYNYVLQNNYPIILSLKQFYLETSFIDYECLKSILIMAPNIELLSIRGKMRTFTLSYAHQRLFINPNSRINSLELYPQFPLDILSMIKFSSHFSDHNKRLILKIPLSSVTSDEYSNLCQNGWTIFPLCSRC